MKTAVGIIGSRKSVSAVKPNNLTSISSIVCNQAQCFVFWRFKERLQDGIGSEKALRTLVLLGKTNKKFQPAICPDKTVKNFVLDCSEKLVGTQKLAIEVVAEL